MTNTQITTRRSRGRPKGKAPLNARAQGSFGPLGDLMRTQRHQLGLGLADVAKACQCSVQFVSNMEHGRAPLPWEKLSRVAKVLRIKTETLRAANLSIRSEFQGFMGRSSKGSKGLVKGQILKTAQSHQGAASLLALATEDRALMQLIESVVSMPESKRKTFTQSALKLVTRS